MKRQEIEVTLSESKLSNNLVYVDGGDHGKSAVVCKKRFIRITKFRGPFKGKFKLVFTPGKGNKYLYSGETLHVGRKAAPFNLFDIPNNTWFRGQFRLYPLKKTKKQEFFHD